MSEAHREAAKARWAKRREQAAAQAGAQAEAAAETIDDAAPQDDVPISTHRVSHADSRAEMLMELRGRPEDDDEVEQQLSDHVEEVTVPRETDPTVLPSDEPVNVKVSAPESQPELIPEPPKTVKAKVNGQEFDVPQSEIDEAGGLNAWQKVKASDLLLERTKAETKQMHQQMQQMQQIIQSLQPQKAPEPQKTLLDLAKEKAPLLQYGTPDESAAAIAELFNAGAPKIDQNAIITQAMSAFEQKLAVQQFKDKNPDIAANPYVASLAIILEKSKLSQGIPQDWNKFYTDLAVELRNGLGMQNPTAPTVATQPAAPNPTGTVADKLARKADIVALPTSSARAPMKEEQKPLTRDDKIALMRKSRGQPT